MGTNSTLSILPLPWFYENIWHVATRVQDFIYLHLCLAVHLLLFFGIDDNHVIHNWEFIMSFALGT